MALSKTDGRKRESCTTMAGLGELLGTVTCTSALVLAVALPLTRWEPVSTEQTHSLLTVAMATIGAAAAILGTVAARLTGDIRLSCIAAAVACHCMVVLPVTVLRPSTVPEGAVPQVAWLAGLVFVVGLLVVGLRPPALLGLSNAWIAIGAGALVALVACELAAQMTGARPPLIVPAVLSIAVLAGWSAVGFALLFVGYHDRNMALGGIAVGLTVLASVHLYWTTAGAVRGGDLLFDQLRLFGLVVVFAGMLGLARRALVVVRAERLAHDEEMRLAAVQLQRAADQAAERDHDLRNGLAGLSGITTLLSSSATSDEREALRSLMLTELARLSAMIDGTDQDRRSGAPTSYDVGVELHKLVNAHRTTGAEILVEPAQTGLRALGSPAVLARVMANLLANCARHAPGSAVWVGAGRCNQRILVTVRDEGPGISSGQELAVLERGVRDRRAGGHGLGLYLSRRLLAGEGADLRILPRGPGSTGCTVVVELPVAPDASLAEPVHSTDRCLDSAPRTSEPVTQ